MIKHRLPSREVLDRYAPTVRFNIIHGYHRKLASKHRWFVREWQDEIVAEWLEKGADKCGRR